MESTRINARLSKPLAAYVARMVGEDGLYETPSEYIRDLIRRDMTKNPAHADAQKILQGYRDIAAGRYVASTGSYPKDKKLRIKKKNYS